MRGPGGAVTYADEYKAQREMVDLLDEVRTGSYDAIEVVKDRRVCETGAAQYARYRTTELTQTAPRLMVPVLVVRVGGVWPVDDFAGS